MYIYIYVNLVVLSIYLGQFIEKSNISQVIESDVEVTWKPRCVGVKYAILLTIMTLTIKEALYFMDAMFYVYRKLNRRKLCKK